MATPFSAVTNAFIFKITDSGLSDLMVSDLESLSFKYMVSASIKFKQCKKIASCKRDDVNKVFLETLTEEEIDILASLMVLEWLNPLIFSIETLKPKMSTKDYKFYSNANHLDKMLQLKRSYMADTSMLKTSYTYSEISLDKLITNSGV